MSCGLLDAHNTVLLASKAGSTLLLHSKSDPLLTGQSYTYNLIQE